MLQTTFGLSLDEQTDRTLTVSSEDADHGLVEKRDTNADFKIAGIEESAIEEELQQDSPDEINPEEGFRQSPGHGLNQSVE